MLNANLIEKSIQIYYFSFCDGDGILGMDRASALFVPSSNRSILEGITMNGGTRVVLYSTILYCDSRREVRGIISIPFTQNKVIRK